MPCCHSYAHADANGYAASDGHTDANRYAGAECNADAYRYTASECNAHASGIAYAPQPSAAQKPQKSRR